MLPYALRVLDVGPGARPRLQRAVGQLERWARDGAHRRDDNRDGVYEHGRAIRLMDAWWPRMIRAQFKPTLGPRLYGELRGTQELDNEPNNHGGHVGSAYQGGWYGYSETDLRTVLGRNVRGEYSRVYCGNGNGQRCRERLRKTLVKATPSSATPSCTETTRCATTSPP